MLGLVRLGYIMLGQVICLLQFVRFVQIISG
jgi:hypothetical protein